LYRKVTHAVNATGYNRVVRGSDGRTGEFASIESLTESIEHLGEAIAIVRASGVPETAPWFVHVNDEFVRLFGYGRAELEGLTTERLFGARTDYDRLNWLRARVAQGERARIVVTMYSKDGSPVWTEISLVPVRDPNAPGYQIATYRDVTSRKQFEDALGNEKRKLQTTLASIADAVVTVLSDGRVEFVNAAAERMLGIDLVEAYGVPVSEVLRLADADEAAIELAGGAAGACARTPGPRSTWRTSPRGSATRTPGPSSCSAT
jgi:PAS domain S-box-containing protein